MYYKIVSVEPTNLGNKYFSYAAASSFANTQYFKTKKAFAPTEFSRIGYGLLVFNSLYSLILFSREYKISFFRQKVFTCRCGKELDLKNHLMYTWSLHPKDWAYQYDYKNWPTGTSMVESVKLLDDITNDVLQLTDIISGFITRNLPKEGSFIK